MCVKLNQTFEFIKKISTVAQYRIKISCGTESIKNTSQHTVNAMWLVRSNRQM